ncbi:MAG: MATE family efflux transporter [Bdellovibrionota bacterium]
MIRLALPVVLSYLGLMTMNMVDLLFVGRVSAGAIGAVGFSNAIFSWFLIFGIGIVTGMDYLVSHAFGAGKREDCHRWLAQGNAISFAYSIPVTLLLYWLSDHLGWFRINPEVAELTAPYLRLTAFGLMPSLLFTTVRIYLQGMGIARPATAIMLGSNLINIAANYALVLGHWGFSPGGVHGSAMATLFSRTCMVLAIGGYAWIREPKAFSERFEKSYASRLIRFSLPSALQMTMEVGVFGLATALAAKLSAADLAAHQIALNIASFTFMVPLGVGSATAVLVGQAVGAGDYPRAQRTGWHGLALGVGFMAFSALTLILFRHEFLGFYTHDLLVLQVGAPVLLIAGLFQLSDGAQTVATGALRGVADTKTPMVANLVGHWMIGLPLGVYLCFYRAWGLRGLWCGLSIGLTFVAIALLWKWRLSFRRFAV